MKSTIPNSALQERPDGAGRLRILAVYGQTVLWSMGEGKGAVSFTRTLESLATRGHEVRVSLPAAPQDEPGIVPYRGFFLHHASAPESFIPRASLPLPRRLWERARLWMRYQEWAVARALEVADAMPPDLVLGLGAFEASAAHRVGSILGVPNATRLFGAWTPYRDRWRQIANFPERAAIQAPAAFLLITNDGSQGDRLTEALQVPRDRLHFLRNGLDFDRFCPGPGSPEIRASLGVAADQPLLMTVTRLAAEKKIERAIDAMPGLLQRVPHAVLALVGDGDLRPALVERARALGIEDHVRFPGAVVQGDLPAWYRTADLVLSLLDRTNASNPVFEAMACGCPVVALDSGSTREVVHDGVNGIVVGYGDLARLGDRLADLLERPELRERIATQANASIRAMLTSPERRLAFEIELIERAARREPLPRWLTA